MNFVPMKREEVKKIYRLGPNQRLLFEFVDSGLDCAKLENYPHKSARVCQTCLHMCAVHLGLRNSVRISIRGDDVYLLRRKNDDQK